MMIVNGTEYILVEPMASLNQCRAIAEIMYKNRNQEYPDAKCVGVVFDKDSK